MVLKNEMTFTIDSKVKERKREETRSVDKFSID